MPDVTVAIPTFRRPEGLERLLVALANLETDARLDVLVADNDTDRRDGIAVVERLRSAGYRWPIAAMVVAERGIAQARNALVERARGQLSTASSAGCRIHDREIGFVHRETIAPRSICLPIWPARMTRLIFIAALRGKS